MTGTGRISLKGVIIMFAILAAAIFLVKCTVGCLSAAFGEVTQEEAVRFLEDRGWKIKPDSGAREEVVIPVEFSEVYQRYNNLQLKQGYDLSAYRGETVTKYTFVVLNFTEYDGTPCDNAEAHLLVWGGQVIGGDVCSLSVSGRMVGLEDGAGS